MRNLNNNGDYIDPFNSDNPLEDTERVDPTLAELMDILDQKLANRPSGMLRLLRIWKSEVNNLVAEVNEKAARKLYKAV